MRRRLAREGYARGHHDLVIQPFRAWRQTFPFLAAGRSALAAVELLVELAADNAARLGRGHRDPLASALRALASDRWGTGRRGRARAHSGARAAAGQPGPAPAAPRGRGLCVAAVVLVCLPPVILLAS